MNGMRWIESNNLEAAANDIDKILVKRKIFFQKMDENMQKIMSIGKLSQKCIPI